MSESQYTARVGRLLPDDVYLVKINVRFGAGVPESWYSGPVRDLWVEWKWLTRLPPLIDPRKLLTGLQQDWLIKRHHEGRHTAVIIGCEKGGIILPNLTWQTPIPRADFLVNALHQRAIAEYIRNFTCESIPTITN